MLQFMIKATLKSWSFTVIFPIVIFGLILYSLGYPKPFDDDLFFIGAALNLAQDGDFVNPLLSQWSERTAERFFVQPPFHSYVLAGWLMLVGISTKSILFFQFICYTTFSIFTALILKFYRFHRFAIYAVILCFATWILETGLRQDALGIAFLAMGIWCLTRNRFIFDFLGFSGLGASILTAPVLLAYAIPFSLALTYANFQHKKQAFSNYIKLKLIALLLAFFTILGLFLIAINFEIFHFLSDLSWHASFRRNSILEAIPAALWTWSIGYGEIIHGSLFALLSLCLFLLWKQRKQSPVVLKSIIFVIVITLVLNIFTYASTVTGCFIFFCWLGVILILAKIALTPLMKAALLTLAAFIFIINNSFAFVTEIGQQHTPFQNYQEIHNYIQTHPQKQYIVDEVAARFIFDYRLPPNSLSWMGSTQAPALWPNSFADKPQEAIWIISTQKAWHIPELPDYPRVEIFGRRFASIARRPYDLIIVK
jgi:hypothetical protein